MSRALVSQEGSNVPVRRVRRGDRQARYLAQSVILEEAGSPALIRMAMFAICGAIACFIVWAAITDVEEVTIASGEVVPTGQVQMIQHLEGGIISEILVKDGDLVEQGQTLIRLSAAAATGELREARARLVGLELKAERHAAVAEGREPDFAAYADGDEFREMVLDQQAIYEGEMRAAENRRKVYSRQIAQRESEVALYKEQEATLREQLKLLNEELDMRTGLLKKGLTTRVVYLDLQREVNRARGDLAKLIGEKRTSMLALSESRSRLNQLNSDTEESALNQRGVVIREIAQVRESIRKLEDRVRRLDIKAPVRGIANGLKSHTIGGVIVPGNIVLEIVPMDKELIVEARISTRDVGHIQAGHPAKVKIVTYDFARYGGITGEVRDVSASTYIDEAGDPYYKAVISMDRSYVGFDPERNRVLPGMTVQADISTGKKTLLQYLLKPVYSSVNQAFRER